MGLTGWGRVPAWTGVFFAGLPVSLLRFSFLASALRWIARWRAADFVNAVLEDVDATLFATGFFATGFLATDLFVMLAMAVSRGSIEPHPAVGGR